jgi:hypothetical protein
MGRVVKRVALGFEWPLNNAWSGYLNPHYEGHYHKCPHCHGSGYSPEAKALQELWYGHASRRFDPASKGSTPFLPSHPVIQRKARHNVGLGRESTKPFEDQPYRVQVEAERLAQIYNSAWCHHLSQAEADTLVEENRLSDLTHVWTPETRWQPRVPAVMPTAAMVNEWSLTGFGHDGINCSIVVAFECKRLGLPMQCSHCNGEGSSWSSTEARELAEAWTPEEPPAGEGYQVWETVSEGSPISPVFADPELLARWMVSNSTGLDRGTSFESWLKFIQKVGWAPSSVLINGEMLSGVVATVALDVPEPKSLENL